MKLKFGNEVKETVTISRLSQLRKLRNTERIFSIAFGNSDIKPPLPVVDAERLYRSGGK